MGAVKLFTLHCDNPPAQTFFVDYKILNSTNYSTTLNSLYYLDLVPCDFFYSKLKKGQKKRRLNTVKQIQQVPTDTFNISVEKDNIVGASARCVFTHQDIRAYLRKRNLYTSGHSRLFAHNRQSPPPPSISTQYNKKKPLFSYNSLPKHKGTSH